MTGGTRLAGLVLCGGASRRMGTDKALLEVGGVPLVVRVARRVAAVADPVILAPGSPGRLGDLGYPEVADDPPGAGPLSGLAAGLAASPHPLVAVAAADMPFASAEVFALLAGMWSGEDALVPVTGAGPQPLHAVYARACLPRLREALAGGHLALREALAGLRVHPVPEARWRGADPSGRFAVNVNSPQDLAALGWLPEPGRAGSGGSHEGPGAGRSDSDRRPRPDPPR